VNSGVARHFSCHDNVWRELFNGIGTGALTLAGDIKTSGHRVKNGSGLLTESYP